MSKENNGTLMGVAAIIAIGLFALCIGGCMWGLPKYNVWKSSLSGEAEFVKAQQNRQIAVQEAQAAKDSSILLAEAVLQKAKGDAQAEIERAKGAAKANEIIGKSLDGNEAYLRYLWIEGLKQNDQKVIYVPTEANLPILEARNPKS